MTDKFLDENGICKAFKYYGLNHPYFHYRPKDFIAYKVEDKWKVTFTYKNIVGYNLNLKKKEIKILSSLSTVGSRLRLIGVKEFKVVLNF